ncbi:MAG: hypothetical protein WEA10_09550 [Actinomycetota bacterium]
MSDAGAPTAPASAAPLDWLLPVLWPGPGVHAGLEAPSGQRVVASYAVLPSPAKPRLLVPLGAPRAAAAALLQFNQAMRQPARLRKAAGSLAFRLGAGGRLARATLHVTDDGGGGARIESLLRAGLDAPDAVVAVVLGAVRPNAKPVVQLLDVTGRVVAFAKVAWNELTRALVEREAEVLAAWAMEPPGAFDVPRPLFRGTLGGNPVHAVSAAPQPVLRRGPTEVPVQVVAEIANRGGTDRRAMTSHVGWSMLHRRIANATDGTAIADRAAAALDLVERRWGSETMIFGAWHGDFAPWNTTWHRGRWVVWDWERAGEGVPVGLDAVHWEIQVASHAANRDLRAALATAGPAIDRVLEPLGVRQPGPVLAWYFVERLARYEEARVAGTLGSDDRGPRSALDVLEGSV